MVSQGRWRQAQRFERSFWKREAGRIAAGEIPPLDWYQWRADRLRERLTSMDLGRLHDENSRVLEIGCGPVGVISFLNGAERVGIDPLEPFFGAQEVFAEVRDPGVRYVPGTGEALPFQDDGFDMVISENCIDHVRDVDRTVSEIARVLEPRGLLYLTVNARRFWGAVLHRVLSRLRIDRGHPHTFTPRRLVRLLDRHGFRLVSLERQDYREARRADLRSSSVKEKLKGVAGLSEYLVSTVSRLQPSR